MKKILKSLEEWLIGKFGDQISDLVSKGAVFAEQIFESEGYKEKEDYIFAYLENNLKLPWYLKPFKGMIRNKLSDFIKKLAKDAIELIQKKFEEKSK